MKDAIESRWKTWKDDEMNEYSYAMRTEEEENERQMTLRYLPLHMLGTLFRVSIAMSMQRAVLMQVVKTSLIAISERR